MTDLDFEIAGEASLMGGLATENRRLGDSLAKAEQVVRELRQALAAASGEAEIFKRQAYDIKKRLEALGSGAGAESKKLEERLLASVSELQQQQDKNLRLVGAIVRLTDAINRFLVGAVSGDGAARLALEAAMRGGTKAVSGFGAGVEGIAVSPNLGDGLVVSVRDDLLLVVANLGRSHGVKVGMPFSVIRGDALVGTVRVVDVREKLLGAVIQNLSSDDKRIHIGDRLKVEIQP